MTSLKDLNNVYCVVGTPPKKYIYFTNIFADILTISVTDGQKLWKLDLNPANLESHRKSVGVAMEHFLKKIKASSDPPQMDVSDGDLTCRVTIALSPKPVEFNLHKSGDAEARTALRDLVFLLAERSRDQQKQLEKATSVIENLQQAKHPTDRTPMFDLNDAKSLKTSTKAATKQPGMSVINPGSKKKKLATGVEFD